MSRDTFHSPARGGDAAHPRLRPLSAVALCTALCVAVPAHTDSGAAIIGVSTRVMAQARLIELGALPALDITGEDLARGFVVTSAPARVRVQSNSRTGFALDLLPLGDWFSAVDVTGLQGAVTLGNEGGTIVQRWNGAGSTDLTLLFRFQLAPGLLPGRYPLPLQLRVRALEQ